MPRIATNNIDGEGSMKPKKLELKPFLRRVLTIVEPCCGFASSSQAPQSLQPLRNTFDADETKRKSKMGKNPQVWSQICCFTTIANEGRGHH